MDVMQALDRLEGEKIYDCVFMDPPYLKGWEQKVLERLRSASYIDEKTLIVVEAALGTDFSWLGSLGYEVIKEKKYKTNSHIFVRRLEGERK